MELMEHSPRVAADALLRSALACESWAKTLKDNEHPGDAAYYEKRAGMFRKKAARVHF